MMRLLRSFEEGDAIIGGKVSATRTPDTTMAIDSVTANSRTGADDADHQTAEEIMNPHRSAR